MGPLRHALLKLLWGLVTVVAGLEAVSLRQQAWLMKAIVIELRVTSLNRQRSLTERLMALLFDNTYQLQSAAGNSFDRITCTTARWAVAMHVTCSVSLSFLSVWCLLVAFLRCAKNGWDAICWQTQVTIKVKLSKTVAMQAVATVSVATCFPVLMLLIWWQDPVWPLFWKTQKYQGILQYSGKC